MNRRTFVASAGALLVEPLFSSMLSAQAKASATAAAHHARQHAGASPADYTLKIAPCKLEISPGVTLETIAYNGQVPGPILRLTEGKPAKIDVINASGDPDIVHWHGLAIDSLNDGAMEEGSPMIPAGGRLRYSFTPRPSGTRWYHTHAGAGSNLSLGTYTGQFGFLLVAGKQAPATSIRKSSSPSTIGCRPSFPWLRSCRQSLQTLRRLLVRMSAIDTRPSTSTGSALGKRCA